MPEGKITIVKETSLGTETSGFKLLSKVLFNIVGVEKDAVTFYDLDSFTSVPKLKADIVIAVGERALKQLCDLTGILKNAGVVFRGYNIPVMPVVSPYYVENNASYLQKFAEDIHSAYLISKGIAKDQVQNQYKLVTKIEEVDELISYVKQTGYCSFDFETTELTDMGTFDPNFYCTTLSISFQQGSSFVIPLWHEESPFSDKDLQIIFQKLEDGIFGNAAITKVGQYVKFDMHCAAWCGVTKFYGPYHCTMLLHHLINENVSHKLKDMVREYYPRFANYEKNLGLHDWDRIPLNTLAPYNAIDSDITLRLYWQYTDILLSTEERIYLLYRNLTSPNTKVLFKMEEDGMLIDKVFITESAIQVNRLIEGQELAMRAHPEVKRFEEYRQKIECQDMIVVLQEKYDKEVNNVYATKKARENQQQKIKKIEELITGLKTGGVGYNPIYKLNLDSPEQLKELIFTKHGFGFEPPKRTSYRFSKDSTNADNLELIKDKTGFLEELKVYRQLTKISRTYLKGILDKLDSDHYIHTTFNQHITKTGRLSSNNPNLQNVITRTKYKVVEEAIKLVKGSFIVPPGYTMLSADYSQIELRLIAYYAEEDTMLKAYQTDQDLHEVTAANSKGYTLEEFQDLKEKDPKKYKRDRFEAKAENFGWIYGQHPPGFQEYARTTYGIEISLKSAERSREMFFKKYPKLLDYHKEFIGKANKFGYVRTFFGRKVRLPDIKSINGGVRGHAERNAINSPIQGTAGELTIFAMILLSLSLPPEVIIINDVHDNIIFYIPNNILDETKRLIRHVMEKPPLDLYFGRSIENVPIKIEFETSEKSWQDLK